MAGRSGSRMSCAIRIVHVEETRSAGFPVWSQNRWRWFGGLGLKTTTTVSWFGPLNQGERRFVGLCLKTDGWMKTVRGHASTSGGLLRSEVSHARVSQFGLKTGGGVAADDAHGIIAEISSRRRKRRTV